MGEGALARRHAAEVCCSAGGFVGNVQVTVVPCPTADLMSTAPPCRCTNERTIERPRPAPRCCEPSEWLSNRSNTRGVISGGMPGPWSVTENAIELVAAFGVQADDTALGREADRVGQKIEEHLPNTAFVGREQADVGGIGVDIEHDIVLDQAVADAFGRGFHGLADVHLPKIKRHGAGIDGREIENVIDQRKQRVGRDRDVAEVFGLPIGTAARSTDRQGNAQSR